MKRGIITFVMALAMICSNFLFAQEKADQPILTFGCLSDLHSELGLISGSVENVRLRGTITNTLSEMKKAEKLDLIVLGGDYTSDVTIPEANWLRSRELLVNATRDVFEGKAQKPVIYMDGNHDYEVANFDALPKKYNAGNYYDTPMKRDLGTLPESECMYEMAPNGTSDPMKLLVAYHYVIKGFDFVVLNTGKNFFKSAWDYSYSQESVEWVLNKLNEIYASDPNKTVFFLIHIPFSDSNSISNTNKGISGSVADLLKKGLAKHPNLIMLYGHDHGKDTAYTRVSTSQRVTYYDTDGNKIETPQTASATGTVYNIAVYGEKKYLGVDANNLNVLSTPTDCSINPSTVTTGSYVVAVGSGSQPYLHCGSAGTFSGNSANSNACEQIQLYKVSNPTAATITATKATSIEDGSTYLLVAPSSNTSKGSFMMKTSAINVGTANQRMDAANVTISGNTITYTKADASALWTLTKKTVTPPEPVEGTSFFSEYMGGMRYYSNSIEGDVSVNNSKIVQALMIYVYKDSVKLQMKNYGESGTFANGSITINKILTPFVVKRSVSHSEDQKTDAPSFAESKELSTGEPANIGVKRVGTADIFYTVDGSEPTENSLKAKDSLIDWTPTVAGTYTIKMVARDGIRAYSDVVSATYVVKDATPLDYCEPAIQRFNATERPILGVTVAGLDVAPVLHTPGSSYNMVYNKYLTDTIKSHIGDSLRITLNDDIYWMHFYVYVDFNHDGTFDTSKELVSYTFYSANNTEDGVDSKGVARKYDYCPKELPSFAIPADAMMGNTRIRIKCDWNSKDPCGHQTADEGNSTTIQGANGTIIDYTINIAPKAAVNYIVSYDQPANGTLALKNKDAKVASGDKVQEGTELTVVATPNKGYKLDKILVNNKAIQGNKFIVAGATTVSASFVESTVVASDSIYKIQNYQTKKYLGFNTYNLTTIDTPANANVKPSKVVDKAFTVKISGAPTSNPFLYYSTGSGRFSGNKDSLALTSQIHFFKVDDPIASTISATLVDKVEAGKTYLLVVYKSDNSAYMLTNGMYQENTDLQRMIAKPATVTSDNKIMYNVVADTCNLWTMLSDNPVTPMYKITYSNATPDLGSISAVDVEKNVTLDSGGSVPEGALVQFLLTLGNPNYLIESFVVNGTPVDITVGGVNEGLVTKYTMMANQDLDAVVKFKKPDGVENTNQLSVYYNTVSQTLNINGIQVQAAVYDLTGHQVATTSQKVTDLSSLAPGCYVVKVQGADANKVLKFVKK